MEPPATGILDLRGLKCPLPALRTRRLLAGGAAGAIYRVLATDPMSVIDIPHEVSRAGALLLSQSREDDVFTFEIRVTA